MSFILLQDIIFLFKLNIIKEKFSNEKNGRQKIHKKFQVQLNKMKCFKNS